MTTHEEDSRAFATEGFEDGLDGVTAVSDNEDYQKGYARGAEMARSVHSSPDENVLYEHLVYQTLQDKHGIIGRDLAMIKDELTVYRLAVREHQRGELERIERGTL